MEVRNHQRKHRGIVEEQAGDWLDQLCILPTRNFRGKRDRVGGKRYPGFEGLTDADDQVAFPFLAAFRLDWRARAIAETG